MITIRVSGNESKKAAVAVFRPVQFTGYVSCSRAQPMTNPIASFVISECQDVKLKIKPSIVLELGPQRCGMVNNDKMHG